MIEEKKLLAKEWVSVENYLRKENSDALKLAVMEAEKVFMRVVITKGYKAKHREDKISLALKEIKDPEVFLKSREKALNFFTEVNYDFSDPYMAKEVVGDYKNAINDLLFGVIEETKMENIKYRFWPIYYFLFENRKKIKRFLITFGVIILLMLFIADTEVGKNLFDLFIDKIHLIIRAILVCVLAAFSVLFFITLSITVFESRARKRSKKRLQ